jgi:hypothetical protein
MARAGVSLAALRGRGRGRGGGGRGRGVAGGRGGVAAGGAAGGRRGGGGGSAGRGRNQPSMLAAMREMGTGSASTYFAAMASTPTANTNAARDFYPPLADGVAVDASKHPYKGNSHACYLSMMTYTDPAHNPCYVVDALDPVAARRQGATAPVRSVWAVESRAVVPEILPMEARADSAAKRRRRSGPGPPRSIDMSVFASRVGRADGGDDGDENRDDDDADKEKDPNAALAGEKGAEEDEDVELDADYQVTARFDDDDGYISQDSGDNVALF